MINLDGIICRPIHKDSCQYQVKVRIGKCVDLEKPFILHDCFIMEGDNDTIIIARSGIEQLDEQDAKPDE